MTATAVRLEGADRLVRTLAAAADDLNSLEPAHAHAGEITKTTTAPLVPYLTGTLRATLQATSGPGETTLQAGGSAAPYVIYVRPFLLRGAQASQLAWLAAFLLETDRTLSQVKGL